MNLKVFIVASALAILMLATSCQTHDFYIARAVERARKYAIPRLKDLTETQRDYIRYAPPDLMETPVFQRHEGAGAESKENIVQKCIVWTVPGVNYDIVVFGVSTRRMDDWYPTQLIRKRFVIEDAPRKRASKEAMIYAMNNMLYLSDTERNRIRFSEPEVRVTDFPLFEQKLRHALKTEYDEYSRSLEKTSESLIGLKKDERSFMQTSFIWKLDKKDSLALVAGVSQKDFSGWIPVSAIIKAKDELEKHTLPRETAIVKARQYAVFNLPKLSGTLIDTIRATEPVLLDTSFKNVNIPNTLPEGQKQISLIWKTEYKDEKAVVTGIGPEDMRNWEPKYAGYWTDEELFGYNLNRKKAVEKAIAYGEKQLKLSDSLKEKIKKLRPYIITTDYPLEIEEKKGIIEQNSFIWGTDEKDKFIVITGLGHSSLANWHPMKAAIETKNDIVEHNVFIKNAVSTARNYAKDHPEYVSYKEEKMIMGEEPKIYETDFDLEKIISDMTKGKKKYIPEKYKIQWSFVWNSEEEKAKMVIIGMGNEDLSEWNPKIIFLVDEKELERCIFK